MRQIKALEKMKLLLKLKYILMYSKKELLWEYVAFGILLITMILLGVVHNPMYSHNFIELIISYEAYGWGFFFGFFLHCIYWIMFRIDLTSRHRIISRFIKFTSISTFGNRNDVLCISILLGCAAFRMFFWVMPWFILIILFLIQDEITWDGILFITLSVKMVFIAFNTVSTILTRPMTIKMKKFYI